MSYHGIGAISASASITVDPSQVSAAGSGSGSSSYTGGGCNLPGTAIMECVKRGSTLGQWKMSGSGNTAELAGSCANGFQVKVFHDCSATSWMPGQTPPPPAPTPYTPPAPPVLTDAQAKAFSGAPTTTCSKVTGNALNNQPTVGFSAAYRKFYPEGVAQRRLCNLPPILANLRQVAECNLTANPQFCFWAKTRTSPATKFGPSYLGRGTWQDYEAWYYFDPLTGKDSRQQAATSPANYIPAGGLKAGMPMTSSGGASYPITKQTADFNYRRIPTTSSDESAVAPDGDNKTMLYVGVGVGILVLGGLAYMASRKS